MKLTIHARLALEQLQLSPERYKQVTERAASFALNEGRDSINLDNLKSALLVASDEFMPEEEKPCCSSS